MGWRQLLLLIMCGIHLKRNSGCQEGLFGLPIHCERSDAVAGWVTAAVAVFAAVAPCGGDGLPAAAMGIFPFFPFFSKQS